MPAASPRGRPCDILHCLPVLRRKPGAVRNGAPVKALKGNPGRMRDLLAGREGGGREFAELLVAARDDGMEAAEAACAEALACGAASADLVLNVMARMREAPPPSEIAVPERLALGLPPAADCAPATG